MRILSGCLATLMLIVAGIQWMGIGEKIYHAYTQWQLFKGYTAEIYTTLSRDMTAITYVLSAIGIAVSVFLGTRSPPRLVTWAGRLAATSLTLGLISLSMLLLSDYGRLVER